MNTQVHLTEEQFGELAERGTLSGNTAAQAHLHACQQCSAELNNMREALALFRETTSAFAEREFARTRHIETTRFVPLHRTFSPAFAWATAILLMVGAGLPLSLRHKTPAVATTHHTTAAAPAQISDEALLDDINREVSASVPASMQALEDPTGSTSASATDAQNSSTRKN